MAFKIYSREMRSLVCEDGKIEYELIRKAVKNINLRIDSSGAVKVSANRRVSILLIENFLREKQGFINAAIERAKVRMERVQKRLGHKPQQYTNGEALRILGQTLEIKVIKSVAEGIYFDKNYLYFQVNDPNNVRHMELLYEKWIKSYQREVFEKICHQVHTIFQEFGVEYPIVKIRYMKSRWGSCQPYRGIVIFNSQLIELPLSCIEYVVTHEFVHFIYPNHSKEFYALLTKLLPEWKTIQMF